MRELLFKSLVIVLACTLAACGQRDSKDAMPDTQLGMAETEGLTEDPAASTREHYERITADPTANLDTFLSHLRQLGLENEDGYFLIEGDLLLTKEEVGRWFRTEAVSAKTGTALGAGDEARELLINLDVNGNRDYWDEFEERHLTYAVDKSSFPPNEYLAVIELMNAAGEDWNQICEECAVKFEHVPEHDSSPSHQEVLFVVRKVHVGQYLAAAFFPSWAQNRRFVDIDDSFFSEGLQFDRTGILRHELGHILGYRHEHIQGVRGCNKEGDNWLPLTPYDEHSVMHYFCGGGGGLSMEISPIDEQGHRALYGVSVNDPMN